MYKSDLQYKTTKELEGLLNKNKEEQSWIEEEINSRNNISNEVLDIKNKVQEILNNNHLPYILIKEERKDAGPSIVIMLTNQLTMEVDNDYMGRKTLKFMPKNSAQIYYDKVGNCHIHFSENCIAQQCYEPTESFINTLKNSFKEAHEIRDVLIEAINKETVYNYTQAKQTMNHIFNTSYHSFLTIIDTDGKHEL